MAVEANNMVTATDKTALLLADKAALRESVNRANQEMGFVPDPDATAEEAQAVVAEALRDRGLRPEDNVFSCDIIAAKDARR